MARPIRNPDDPPVSTTILAAASELFQEVGFEKASMKEIAKKSGVTPAALYYHYENKQHLLFHCLKDMASHLLLACTRAIIEVEGDPVEELRELVKAHILSQLNYSQSSGPLYMALVHGVKKRNDVLDEEQKKKLRSLERRHMELLQNILEKGCEEGIFNIKNMTTAKFAIAGQCEHVLNWYKPDGKASAESIAEEFGDYALQIAGYQAGKTTGISN